MATIIIGTLVFAAFALVIYNIYRNKKKGTACGSGCSYCPHSNACKK